MGRPNDRAHQAFVGRSDRGDRPSLDAGGDFAPILNINGGKIITHRALSSALPGGDLDERELVGLTDELARAAPFLEPGTISRLARSYGSRAYHVLDGALQLSDPGEAYWAGLTRAEVDYLVSQEWAMTSEDVLWRRSKLGLHMTGDEITRFASAFDAIYRLTPGTAEALRKEAGQGESAIVTERKAFIGELISEAIAVFIIITIGCSAAAMLLLYDPSPYQTAYLGVCLTCGLAVSIVIYVTDAVSGTHANPAVTLALAAYRGFFGGQDRPLPDSADLRRVSLCPCCLHDVRTDDRRVQRGARGDVRGRQPGRLVLHSPRRAHHPRCGTSSMNSR